MFLSRPRNGCLLVFLMLSLGLPAMTAAAPPAPQVGDNLPDIRLPRPTHAESFAYLNSPETVSSRFAMSHISADLVVVQIFSMYCPHCQREAPRVNELFSTLQQRSNSLPTIRLIGIGVGNSPMEVDVFRKAYKVAFPLFPDGDFTIHKQLGEVRTPFFFAFRPGDTPPHKLRLAHLGPFEDVSGFIDQLEKLAREKTP